MGTSVRHETVGRVVSELCLPARPSALGSARKYAEEAAAAFGFDADGCFEFMFAANEAVTNAIKHGAPDERGQIHLSVVVDDQTDRLMFVVRDRGTFAPHAPDGATRSERGRGLALMAGLMDEVQLCIEPAGTTVRLYKARA